MASIPTPFWRATRSGLVFDGLVDPLPFVAAGHDAPGPKHPQFPDRLFLVIALAHHQASKINQPMITAPHTPPAKKAGINIHHGIIGNRSFLLYQWVFAQRSLFASSTMPWLRPPAALPMPTAVLTIPLQAAFDSSLTAPSPYRTAVPTRHRGSLGLSQASVFPLTHSRPTQIVMTAATATP